MSKNEQVLTGGQGPSSDLGKMQFPSLTMAITTRGQAPNQQTVSAEEQGQTRTKETALAFGTLVSALMRSPRHRKLKLQELEAAIVPPLVLGQFVVAHAAVPNRPGESAPVAALWWALVSPSVDQRLSKEITFPLTLHRDDWKSGDIPWIIDAAGAPATLRSLIEEVSRQALNGVRPKLPPAALA